MTLFKVTNNKTKFDLFISQKSHGYSKTSLEHLTDFLRKNGVDNYTVYTRPTVRYKNQPNWNVFMYNFEL